MRAVRGAAAHPSTLVLEAAACSIAGPRPENQDAGYAGPGLLAVADGVGGKPAGGVASSLAIRQLSYSLQRADARATDTTLSSAVSAANECLRDAAAICPEWTGMTTTLTAVALTGDDRVVVAHIGDARAYLVRDGHVLRLTADHTFVQGLVDAGVISVAQARVHPMRSIVLHALRGTADDLSHVEVAAFPVQRGDRLLVCSDGLSGVVPSETIGRILVEERRPAHAVTRLMRAALAAGSKDDVTAVVGDITVEGAAPLAPPSLVGSVSAREIPLQRRAAVGRSVSSVHAGDPRRAGCRQIPVSAPKPRDSQQPAAVLVRREGASGLRSAS